MLRAEETLNLEVSRINGLDSGMLRIGTFESVTLRLSLIHISVFGEIAADHDGSQVDHGVNHGGVYIRCV